MGVKKIAVPNEVYGRLMTVKREGEALSKLIDRLIPAGSPRTARPFSTTSTPSLPWPLTKRRRSFR